MSELEEEPTTVITNATMKVTRTGEFVTDVSVLDVTAGPPAWVSLTDSFEAYLAQFA